MPAMESKVLCGTKDTLAQQGCDSSHLDVLGGGATTK